MPNLLSLPELSLAPIIVVISTLVTRISLFVFVNLFLPLLSNTGYAFLMASSKNLGDVFNNNNGNGVGVSELISIISGFLSILIAGWFYFIHRVRFVGQDEMLYVELLTELKVFHGPCTVLMPLFLKNSRQKRAVTLNSVEYCVIKNNLTGETRVESGPKMVFLKPYDKIIGASSQLKANDPTDKYKDKQHIWESTGGKKDSFSLKRNEFIRFVDKLSGKIRVEKGEQGNVVPSATEECLDIGPGKTGLMGITSSGKRVAPDLSCFEWIKILDKSTGKQRTVRGEATVFLREHEEFVGSKQKCVDLNEETAVLVRNKRTGAQMLVQEKDYKCRQNNSDKDSNTGSGSTGTSALSFAPDDDEEVLDIRKRIKLANHEAIIIRDKEGKDSYMFGNSKNAEERSFFLPPYCEVVQLVWSRGRRRERKDLVIEKIDLRPMYMSFEFNCRTRDNVELTLEGSFFWEITSLQAMNTATSDTTGDLCNHARSKFIEKVSKVTLQDFMNGFNEIARSVYMDDCGTSPGSPKQGPKDSATVTSSSSSSPSFYTQRGVKIHSLEVTSYRCADSHTASVLGQIIQETTNRMNRLQCQESETEVKLFKIEGDISEEKKRTELLEIQSKNQEVLDRINGQGEAERVKAFLQGLNDTVPDLGSRIKLWEILRKKDTLEIVAGGDGCSNRQFFYTPGDCNLSIETKGDQGKGSSGSGTKSGV